MPGLKCECMPPQVPGPQETRSYLLGRRGIKILFASKYFSCLQASDIFYLNVKIYIFKAKCLSFTYNTNALAWGHGYEYRLNLNCFIVFFYSHLLSSFACNCYELSSLNLFSRCKDIYFFHKFTCKLS